MCSRRAVPSATTHIFAQLTDVLGEQFHRLRQGFVAFHQPIQAFVDGHNFCFRSPLQLRRLRLGAGSVVLGAGRRGFASRRSCRFCCCCCCHSLRRFRRRSRLSPFAADLGV